MNSIKRNKKFYGIVLSILVVIALIVFAVNSISAWDLCCSDLKNCGGIQCCGGDGAHSGCLIRCNTMWRNITCPPEY